MRRDPVNVVTSPSPQMWDELVAGDRESLPCQTRAWIEAIQATGGGTDASRLYEFPSGRRFLLPLVRRGLPATLTVQASMPHSWGMGGLVGPAQPSASEAAAIFADLRREPVLRTSLRPNPLQDDAWAAAQPAGVARVPRLAHVLDLDGGFDKVWGRFRSVARTAVRKAERAGLEIECDTTGRLVPSYYRLYELSLERWAQHQHEPRVLSFWRGHRRDPQSKLAAIARILGEQCQVWLASLDGRPIAGIIVLRGANASYTRGAMDISLAGPTRANYLLQKLAIEDACAHGCRRYHMGESGESDRLAQYKTRFGALPVAYGEYHVERLPLTAADRKLRGAVKQAIGFKD